MFVLSVQASCAWLMKSHLNSFFFFYIRREREHGESGVWCLPDKFCRFPFGLLGLTRPVEWEVRACIRLVVSCGLVVGKFS